MKTSFQQASRELEEDHRRLHALVEEIGRIGDRRQVATALTTLHERLAAHFNLEEKPGGLYDTLGVCAPEFRRVLAQLVDDHFRLASTVRDLRERSRDPWGPAWDMLPADVARLAAALADHERREQQMVDAALAREPQPDLPAEAPDHPERVSGRTGA